MYGGGSVISGNQTVKLWKIAGSRWFYIGVPTLCIFLGLFGAAGSLIGGAVSNTYHPVVPSTGPLFAMKAYAGLAIAGLASLILMATAKFAFRSPRRAVILAAALGFWFVGVAWLALTSVPGEDAYKRTFEGQRFEIPWDRVTGEMTSRGNPLGRWDAVEMIGFRYCAKPFNATHIGSDCERHASFLTGGESLTGSGYPRNASLDPDGRGLRAHLVRQQRERETSGALTSRSSNSSSASSSTSGGPSDGPWERIEADRQADVGGMIAFKRLADFPSEESIYLFSKAEPSDTKGHHAECRRGIRNGEVRDPEFVCTHFVRDGQKAWLFDLRLNETERASERLAQLKSQLGRYRRSSSPAKGK